MQIIWFVIVEQIRLFNGPTEGLFNRLHRDLGARVEEVGPFLEG